MIGGCRSRESRAGGDDEWVPNETHGTSKFFRTTICRAIKIVITQKKKYEGHFVNVMYNVHTILYCMDTI